MLPTLYQNMEYVIFFVFE